MIRWGNIKQVFRPAATLATLFVLHAVPANCRAEDLTERLRAAGASDSMTAVERVDIFLPIESATIPVLVRALGDDDPQVRAMAALVLGREEKPKIKVLVRMLKDRDGTVREAAGESLAHIGLPATAGLLRLLDDSDHRPTALAVLTLLNQWKVISRCKKMIRDPDLPVEEKMGAADYILEVTTSTSHYELREQLASFYEKLSGDPSVPDAVRASAERLSSSVLLRQDPRKEGINHLSYRYAGRGRPYRRSDTVYHLSQPVLRELAGHTAGETASLLRERVLDWYYGIRLYLDGRDKSSCRQAIRDAHDWQLLEGFAASDDPRERAAATLFLFNSSERVTSRERARLLLSLVQDPDRTVRIRAMETAGFTRFGNALPIMDRILNEGMKDEEIYMTADDVRGRIGERPPLVAMEDVVPRKIPRSEMMPMPIPSRSKSRSKPKLTEVDRRSCGQLVGALRKGEGITPDVIASIGAKCRGRGQGLIDLVAGAVDGVSTSVDAEVYHFLGTKAYFGTREHILGLLESREECQVTGGLYALDLQLTQGRLQMKSIDEELTEALGNIIHGAQERVLCVV